MTSVVRLSTAVLILGVASLAGASSIRDNNKIDYGADLLIDPDGQAIAGIASTLHNIHQRLTSLERILVPQYGSIDMRLRKLELEQAEVISQLKRPVLTRNIVSAINRGHFRIAEEELSKLGNPVSISDIVQEVYAGSEHNFGNLVNFSQSLSSVESSYKILSTLYDEMKKNGHKDVEKLITLLNAFEGLHPLNNQDKVRSSVNSIIDELTTEITAEASNVLSAAMKSEKHYAYIEGVTAISTALGHSKPEIAAAVMRLAVEKVFKTVDNGKILEAINSHADVWQRIAGMDALYEQLKAAGPLKGTTPVTLAWRVSTIAKLADTEIDGRERDSALTLFKKFPLSLVQLFFLPTFCIYNKLQNSYLVASPKSLYDAERRNVFTMPANESLPKGAGWRVSMIDNKLIFRSLDFLHENIYAALYNYDNSNHYVFTWLPGNNTDDQSAWNLELDGEKCFLKNVHSGEYLYASDIVNMTAGNKYVFAAPKQSASSILPFIWEITDCNIYTEPERNLRTYHLHSSN